MSVIRPVCDYFVQGSRNVTVLSAQMLFPPWLAAHASASVSSIRLANSGGVNTSSLERFAMQVKTSGLCPRSEKLTCSLMESPSQNPHWAASKLPQSYRRVCLGGCEDFVLAKVGEE